MKRSLLFLLFVLTSMLQGSYLRAYSYQFTHINTDNSTLSHNCISEIFQDSRGFIWLGTYKGINRYDGTRFEVYGRKEMGLSSDLIFNIREDHDGNIWVGTDSGVSVYNYRKDRFEPFTKESDKGTVIRNKVADVMVDESGIIWMLVNDQGVFRYDTETDELKMFPYGGFGRGINGFGRILKTSDGRFCLSCYYYNLFVSDEALSYIRPICSGKWSDYFFMDAIRGLFNAGEYIYVISRKHGITKVCLETGEPEHLFSIPKDQFLLDSFMADGSTDIWVSTSSGVWRYNVETGEREFINSQKDDIFSLSDSYDMTVFIDRNNGLWVGTKNGGVNYCPWADKFERQYKVPGEQLTGYIISGFASGDNDIVWVTTERGLILNYNIRTHSLTKYRVQYSGYLYSPCYSAPYLWFGCRTGVERLDTKTGIVKHYEVRSRKTGQRDPRVTLVRETASGDLFIGTSLGLFLYDRQSDSFNLIPAFDEIFPTDIETDMDGCLWISTYANGMYKWDKNSGDLPVHYKVQSEGGVNNNYIYSVFVDSMNRVWAVGFSHGLSYYDRKEDRFINLNESFPELKSLEIVHDMAEDENGRYWISTDKGLVQFNLQTREVKTYTKQNGLLDNKLTNSALVLDDGDMLFSSENGFIRFDPSEVSIDKELPKVSITRMYVADKVLETEYNIDLTEKVVLSHDQNTFGVDISALEISPSLSQSLQCMLEGYDQQWRSIIAGRRMSYYNVPPGEYRLLIRASLGQDEWQSAHAPLEIVVKPRFWQSAPGIILIALIILTLVAAALLLSYYSYKRKSRAVEEARNRQREEEMLQEKMNFFSHVIHEIKTPLTLIKTPLGNVLSKDESLNEDVRRDLKVMRDSTDYLSKLVNELLEFVRIERQGYVLNLESIDMVERLGSLVFDYNSTAEDANLRMVFKPRVQAAIVNADVSATNKILNNLLLNAVKYAESYIEIRLGVDDGMVVIDFINDGPLIPEESRSDVFKVFVQINRDSGRSSSGVGIGLPLARNLARMQSGDLVLNTVNSMTCFTLTLPLSPDGVIEEDLAMDEEEVVAEEGHKPTLVFADDNSELRDWIQSKLSEHFDVIPVPNADTAMKIIRSRNIDFLITDISMPGKSGLDLCRDIRSDVVISHLPIIILSARASVESKIQAMEAGADLYIEKPFDLAYLQTSIRNILDRRVLMRNAFKSGLFSTDIAMFGLPKRDEEFFDKFNSLINANLQNADLGVEWLSEEMCVSQSTLIRKIKKLLNATPKNYIRSIRLAKAAQLLTDSHGNNITDICYAVGFSSVSYFAKCFKEQYGKVPTEYAKGDVMDK